MTAKSRCDNLDMTLTGTQFMTHSATNYNLRGVSKVQKATHCSFLQISRSFPRSSDSVFMKVGLWLKHACEVDSVLILEAASHHFRERKQKQDTKYGRTAGLKAALVGVARAN